MIVRNKSYYTHHDQFVLGLWVNNRISVSLSLIGSNLVLKLHPSSQVRLAGLNLVPAAKVQQNGEKKYFENDISQTFFQNGNGSITVEGHAQSTIPSNVLTKGFNQTNSSKIYENKRKRRGNNERRHDTDYSHVLKQCMFHWGNSAFEEGSEHQADFREAHLEMQCEFMLPEDMRRGKYGNRVVPISVCYNYQFG